MTIRNPLEWSADQLKFGSRAFRSGGHSVYHPHESVNALRPAICRISTADIRDALRKGLDDFGAYRTDVIFLCMIYPIVGLVLARALFGYDMVPLLFPLASGFAIVGPLAGIGLYEMSRRREQGVTVGWADAFGVLRSPSFAAIVVLGLLLLAILVAWLFAAQAIYSATMGPEPPASIGSFFRDVLTTQPGWTMIGVGIGVGFLFALLAFSVSVISFPLLLDRKVGVGTAVWTSIMAVASNPGPMALWAVIVTVGLVAGSIPLLVGLAVVIPVLGHGTWHLYRKVVRREPGQELPVPERGGPASS